MRAPGRLTSGARTVEGNRRVDGAKNSRHIVRDAADYVDTSYDALRKYYGDDAKIQWHKNHWHTEQPGYGKTPYFGKRGTYGLRGR